MRREQSSATYCVEPRARNCAVLNAIIADESKFITGTCVCGRRTE
jgi:hypothetical protein